MIWKRDPTCIRFDEDGGHCFLKCKPANECWRRLQLEHVRQSLLDASSAKEFVKMVLKLDQQIACTVSVLLWKMWDARNKVNAGDPPLSTQIICQITLEVAGLVQKQGTTHKPAAMPKLKWSRPPHSENKL